MEKGLHMLLEDILKKLNGTETVKIENIITLMAFCNLLGVSSVLDNKYKTKQQIIKQKEENLKSMEQKEQEEADKKETTETKKATVSFFDKQKKKYYSSKPLTRLVWRFPPY